MKQTRAQILEISPLTAEQMDIELLKGCLEGMNNKIKAIKRVAYGFRTFRNFKKRILLMNKTLTNLKKQAT